MIVRQTELPQTININAILNKENKVTVGFQLVSESKPKPKDCNFPIVRLQELGIENLVSAKLVWRGAILMEYEITDGFENNTQIVYNLLKSQCNTKNKFQLYVTTRTNETTTVEHFVAEGFIYVYF